jgi:hypothetical protein
MRREWRVVENDAVGTPRRFFFDSLGSDQIAIGEACRVNLVANNLISTHHLYLVNDLVVNLVLKYKYPAYTI